MISKKKVGQRICYHISSSEVSELVSSILAALEPFEIKASADALKDRAVNLIDKLEERSEMIKHARGTFRA